VYPHTTLVWEEPDRTVTALSYLARMREKERIMGICFEDPTGGVSESFLGYSWAIMFDALQLISLIFADGNMGTFLEYLISAGATGI
jgi:hypothetical protein